MKKIVLSVMLLTTYGAFSQINDTIYVNPLATTGNDDGTSWADAYLHPASAFNNSTDNNHIWIAQGTYISSATARNLVYGWTTDYIQVYGGFSGNGTETSITQRDWDLYPTIFSGDIGIANDDSDNSTTVFVGPIGSALSSGSLKYAHIDGIKIKDGNANTGSYQSFSLCGGGIAVDEKVDKIVFKNVEIYENYGDHGAAIWYSQPSDGEIVLENVSIHDNQGGTSPAFEFRNSGGVLNINMINCLVYNNEASSSIRTTNDYGSIGFLSVEAGIYNFKAINCTFANNTNQPVDDSKGDIRTYKSGGTGNFLMQNCIMYNNANDTSITRFGGFGGTAAWDTYSIRNNTLEYNTDIANGTFIQNTNTDPLFTNGASDDFSLQSTSPAIGGGSSSGISALIPALDFAGNTRVRGNYIDMGAYEYQPSTVGIIKNSKDNLDFTVYPNPTNGIINIQSTVEVESIIVMNSLGQVIVEVNNQNSVDLTGSPKGLYVVAVKTKNKVITKKVIMK